jgi:hypothetical protein
MAGNLSIGKLEHLSTFKGKITEVVDFGETPVGKRYDVLFEGSLSGERLSGRMRGVDYVLVRSDGVSELHVRASIVTEDKAAISAEISGYLQNGEIRDAMVKFMTGNEKYMWMTSKIIVGRGTFGPEGLEISYFFES